MGITQMPDLTTTPGAVSGSAGLRHGRPRPSRRRRAHGLRQLHHHGPSAPGGPRASAPRVRAGPSPPRAASVPGGSLPMNTNGGGLSFTHPGMYGMFLITEAVRQLRGEGDASSGRRRRGGGGPRVRHVPLGACRPRCSAPRPRCEHGRPAATRPEAGADALRAAGGRRERTVLGGHPRGAPPGAVVHGL